LVHDICTASPGCGGRTRSLVAVGLHHLGLVMPRSCPGSSLPGIAINKVDGGLRMAPLTRRVEIVCPSLARRPYPWVCGPRLSVSDLLQIPRACQTCEPGTGTLTARDGLDAHNERAVPRPSVKPVPGRWLLCSCVGIGRRIQGAVRALSDVAKYCSGVHRGRSAVAPTVTVRVNFAPNRSYMSAAHWNSCNRVRRCGAAVPYHIWLD
jgi:hypothetical protein